LVEKYGSNARASASASMPMPVSDTRILTDESTARAATLSDPDPGIACSAFSTMFVSDRATSVRST